ncbi:MAG: hypothetical protein ABSA97_07355 [Verrucomicrobiia bacterium]
MPKAEITDQLDDVLAAADPNEASKINAALKRYPADVAGYSFHAFNEGRKLLLKAAGIMQRLLETFQKTEELLAKNKCDFDKLSESEKGQAVLNADPLAYFTMCTLAFICVHDGKEIAPYCEKPDTLYRAAIAWQDSLDDNVRDELIARSAEIFFNARKAEDFQVAGDGRFADPNALTRPSMPSTARHAAGRAWRKAGNKRPGAKSRSNLAGKPSTPNSHEPESRPSEPDVTPSTS